jgi:hypothetical protein
MTALLRLTSENPRRRGLNFSGFRGSVQHAPPFRRSISVAAHSALLLLLSVLFGFQTPSVKPATIHGKVVADNGMLPRTISFSGYEWRVKSSADRVGPGPNYFSDSAKNVWLDKRQRLHLKITHRHGRWECAEVVSTQSFGYGTYRFYLETASESIDPNVTLGLFTWNDERAYHHREIDVEVSRWAKADNEDAQFVVQPFTTPENIVRFRLPAHLRSSVHGFIWKPDSVYAFSQRAGPNGETLRDHTFTAGIPQAGGENARINLWLNDNHGPTNDREVEVVLSRFEFTPLPTPRGQ